MKILYVKNNSERAKEYQLKTIIYEKNGEKFVKKQALCAEAIPHLKKMKDSYTLLNKNIINPKIKLAKIIAEEDDSLTFEFIEGTSFEKIFNKSSHLDSGVTVLNEYHELLKNSFKTLVFDSSTMITDEYKKVFGDIDYSEFDGKLCFEGISNIDYIFSNLILKDQSIYVIDYEWVYNLNIPINYVEYRALHNDNDICETMEDHFINKVVINSRGFYKIKNKYLKKRTQIEEKEMQIQEKEMQIQEKMMQLQEKENQIYERDIKIRRRDEKVEELNNLVESMRIKNRIKRLLGV